MGNIPPLGHLQIGDPVQLIKMYLLYLDESGTHSSARHFVLAGVAVLETDISWAKTQLDLLQSQYLPDVDGSVHFHSSVLHRQDGDEVPGPVTNQLLAAWSERVGLDIVDQFKRLPR